MSGYRCVNYYELCRLCTSTASHGTKKVHIFSEEGRKKNLFEKIADCLPIVVSETDKLPKIVCAQCLNQVETIVKFRETCVNAQSMLESCLNSSKLRNGGKVYIKDVSPKKTPTSPPLLKTITNTSTPITIGHTTLTKTPVQNSKNSNDFLSSIIQAVGIQNVDESNEPQIINNIQPVQQLQQQQQQQQQPVQQYTITLDGKTLKSNQIHYKIEPTGTLTFQEPSYVQQTQSTPTQQTTISNNTYSQVNEFLKLKPANAKVTQVLKRKEPTMKIIETTPSKKPKINLVLASSPVQQQQKIQTNTVTQLQPANTITVANSANKTQAITLQDLKFLSSGNKCFLPITVKDGSNNDQQIMAQIDAKSLVLPGTYLQMKVDPQQIATVDGQQVVQLTSATNLPTSIALAQPQQYVHTQQTTDSIQHATLVPETRTIFTTASGQNITITQDQLNAAADGKVHFTTLQNVAPANITLPLPETSAITFQRIKVEPSSSSPEKIENQKPVSKPQIFKLPTLSNATTLTTSTSTAQTKTTSVRRATAAKTGSATPKQPNNKVTILKMEGSDRSTTTTASADANAESGAAATGKSDVPTCEICDKVFKRKEHLAQHVKLHLGLRPFKCEEPNCNKAFSRKEHLMRHCVSHTGKKQFDCDICHKLFSRKDNLNKHKKSHEQKQQQQQQQQQQDQQLQEVQQQQTLVYTVTEVN